MEAELSSLSSSLSARLGVPTAPPCVTPLVVDRTALREFIAADLAAHGLDRRRFHFRLTHRVVHFQVLLRRAEYWDAKGGVLASAMAAWLRLRSLLLGEKLGFTLPRHVAGPGLSLAHVGTVTISGRARIGRRCRIHTDVCIGELGGAAPQIGDDVWIGPGAKLFGGIRIGDGVAVGANAVVMSDVPDGVTVAGVPARVVSRTGSGPLLGPIAAWDNLEPGDPL